MKNIRKMWVGIAAVMVMAIFAAGCGGGDSTDTSTSATGTVSTTAKTTAKTTPTQTATSTPAAVPAQATEPATPPSGSPASGSAPAASQLPLQITAQYASPELVSPGGMVTITCFVKGDASSVTVEISKKMDSSFQAVTYPLAKSNTSGGESIWSAAVPAPAISGLYAFSTFATDAGGNTVKNELGEGPYEGASVYFTVQ